MGRVAFPGPCLLRFGRTRFPLGSQERAEGSSTREDHVPVGAVEGISAVVPVHAVGSKQPILVDQHSAVGVLVVDHHVVGVLAVTPVVSAVHRVASVGGDANRLAGDTQSPASHVEVVDSVVPDVSVAIVAVDSPVAVKPVHVEASDRSRPQPAVVVDIGGRLGVGDHFSGPPSLHVPGLGDADVSDQPRVEQFSGRRGDGAGSHLRPVLDHSLELPRRGDDRRTLVEDVRHRLLEVDVLAGRECQQGDTSVPVVRRADDDHVDVVVLDNVLEPPGPLRRGLLVSRDHRGDVVHLPRIDVAQPRDVDVRCKVAEAAGVGVHDPAAADQSDAEGLGRCRPVGQQRSGDC